MLTAIKILLIVFFSSSDILFDRQTHSVYQRIIYKFNGYRSFANEGPLSGCCGEKRQALCMSCQYVVNIEKTNYLNWIAKKKLGTYRMPAKESYEIFYMKEYYDSKNIEEVQYDISNNVFNRNTVDFTNPIPLKFNIIYDLSRTHGNMGRMIIYASVEMYSVDINYYQRDFFIKLHSLYWNKYEITNGQCCSKNTLKSCDIPCDYFLEFLISGGEFVYFNMFLNTKLKEMRLYLYTVSTEYAPNSKYNISIIVLNESDDDQIIDIANINPEKYSSTEAFLGINLKGKYGNVDFTVSFGYICNRYTSPFYINKCHAIHKIEYCDYKTGIHHCINGAEDIYCERNLTLFCNEDICNRKGICKITNKKIFCKCNKGYKGKYCENLICRNDCNGNGYCLNEETCACNSIYRGKLCNEYPCSKSIINPCTNGGICYQTNNSIKCYCPFGYIKGKYCQILSCGNKCKNGKCIFSIKDVTYKCVCMGRWYGSACGILGSDHTTRWQYIVMVTSNLVLVSLDITFLIVIAYFYRKINITYNIGGLKILKISLNLNDHKITPNSYFI